MMKYRKLLLLLLLLAGPASLGDTNAQIEQPKTNTGKNYLEFEYCYDFNVPGKTPKIKLIAVLPRTIINRQKVLVNYSTKPSRVYSKNGNRYAEFFINRPKKNFKITINFKVDFFRYDLTTAQREKEKRLFKGLGFRDALKHEKYIEKDDPKIQQITKNITGQTEMETVKNIYDYVIDYLEYHIDDKTKGALDALKYKKGQCIDYADLFVALCRAKRIPARVAKGYTPKFYASASHAWAEVYFKEYGWVPFDPTWGDKEDPKRRARKFRTMKECYIYFTHIRNDETLNNHSLCCLWYWGDKVEMKKYIKLKQAPKTADDSPEEKIPASPTTTSNHPKRP